MIPAEHPPQSPFDKGEENSPLTRGDTEGCLWSQKFESKRCAGMDKSNN